jgi:3-oxoadipate enol-lactonase
MTACEVRHEVSGPAGAPTLVLTGSLGTSSAMWDPQAGPLGERFRLVRYDVRGHGRSPVPPGPYEISDLGEDLIALLDRLEIERALLCGLSIGGMIGMWTAAHAPERVERLAVICTSAHLGPAAAAYAERAATVRSQGVEAVADAVLERWFTPGFRQANPGFVARMREMLVATPREGYAGCCEALAAMDLRADLDKIRAPTLVLAGEDDLATPPEHGRAIAEGVSGAQLSVVSQAAHLASVERAEVVTSLLLRFLDPSEEEAR